MTTISGPLWPIYALAIVVCLLGFGFGVCAALGTGPGRAPDPEPLPRSLLLAQHADRTGPAPPPDLWETVPLALMSEHYALIDATGREADQLTAAWRDRWLR